MVKKKIKKKNKKKVEKIKYNKFSKMTLIICICFSLLSLILAILGAFVPKLQVFLWENVEIYYLSIKYVIGQLLKFQIGIFTISPYIILLIVYFAIALYSDMITQSKKVSKDKKYKYVNIVRIPLLIITAIVVINTIEHTGIEYNNTKIDTIYFESESKKEYTLQDLNNTFSFLENKVIELSKIQKRDSDGKIQYKEIENIATTDLKNSSKKYKILRGYYPKMYYKFNDNDFSVDPSTYGITKMDTIGINYYQEAPQLLNTITHELCHTRGIVRENEAVLCSVIVGVESDNKLSNYAAYLEAYSRFAAAYELIDSKKVRASEERIFDLCHTNNYQEICNFYRKDTRVYVKGSKSIEIQTYKIGAYEKDYLEEFLNYLEEYDMKLYINDKKTTKENVFNPNNENKYLKIEIKNNEEIYSKIKDYLNSNKEKFIYIIEIYDGMYEGVDMSKNEAIKYYTSPIPNSNVFSLLNQKEMLKVFDYSRSTRLIMEYFDYKNIN